MSADEPTPRNARQDENQSPEVVAPKKTPTKPIPDFQPLGTVRDWFNEQLKQDQPSRW